MNFGRQGHTDNDTDRLFQCYVSKCIAELRKVPKNAREARLTKLTRKRADAEMIKKEVFRLWRTQ